MPLLSKRGFSSAILPLVLSPIALLMVSVSTYGVEPSVPGIKNLIKVPMTRQATDHTCGTSALQSILFFYGKEIREDKLAEILGTTDADGTDPLNILKYVNETLAGEGFKAVAKTDMTTDDLRASVDAGIPVIVVIQAWADDPKVDWANEWDAGHYVVAVGYDDSNFYFMDPSTLGHYAFIPVSELLTRWHDKDEKSTFPHFGIIVTRAHAPGYDRDTIERLQ
jgi:predicted double-glycine peptidase